MGKIVLISAALLLFGTSDMCRAGSVSLLLTLDVQTYKEASAACAQLESYGFHARHLFPPDKVMGIVDERLVPSIRGHERVRSLMTADETPPYPAGPDGLLARVLVALARAEENTETNQEHWLEGGVKVGVDGVQMINPSSYSSALDEIAAIDPTKMFTSQHLTGRVAVSIILMESDGGTENWTVGAEDDAISKIIQGTDWLCQQAEDRDINISWIYEIHRSVPTPYEPIAGYTMPKGTPSPPLSQM